MVISMLRRIVFFGSVCIFLGSAGGGSGNQEKRQKPVLTEEVPKITVERVAADTTGQKEDSGTERRMRQLGLVDIGEVDPTIAVHLVYAIILSERCCIGISGKHFCYRRPPSV